MQQAPVGLQGPVGQLLLVYAWEWVQSQTTDRVYFPHCVCTLSGTSDAGRFTIHTHFNPVNSLTSHASKIVHPGQHTKPASSLESRTLNTYAYAPNRPNSSARADPASTVSASPQHHPYYEACLYLEPYYSVFRSKVGSLRQK